MTIGRSRLTAQGQISVPADIRKRLGVGPGSVLEWEEEDNRIFVRRAGRFSSEEIHRKIFGGRPPARRSLAELKEGLRRYAKNRHARD